MQKSTKIIAQSAMVGGMLALGIIRVDAAQGHQSQGHANYGHVVGQASGGAVHSGMMQGQRQTFVNNNNFGNQLWHSGQNNRNGFGNGVVVGQASGGAVTSGLMPGQNRPSGENTHPGVWTWNNGHEGPNGDHNGGFSWGNHGNGDEGVGGTIGRGSGGGGMIGPGNGHPVGTASGGTVYSGTMPGQNSGGSWNNNNNNGSYNNYNYNNYDSSSWNQGGRRYGRGDFQNVSGRQMAFQYGSYYNGMEIGIFCPIGAPVYLVNGVQCVTGVGFGNNWNAVQVVDVPVSSVVYGQTAPTVVNNTLPYNGNVPSGPAYNNNNSDQSQQVSLRTETELHQFENAVRDKMNEVESEIHKGSNAHLINLTDGQKDFAWGITAGAAGLGLTILVCRGLRRRGP